MNQDIQLKLQAYLDHELSEREAQEMVTLLESDTEAQALSAELRGIRALLPGNELEIKVPESREFYWSKIERAIQREAKQAQPVRSGLPRWMRVLAPSLGFAALLIAALSTVRYSTSPPELSHMQEIEAPLEEAGVMSFYSPSTGMTVVWVDTRVY